MTRPQLLLVDDDALVLRTFARTLGVDFVVTCAGDVVSALGLIEVRAQVGMVQFDAVLSDLHLPGTNGSDLLEVLTSRHPELAARTVIITGDPPAKDDALATRLGHRYVMKTVPMDLLRDTLKRLAFLHLTTPAATTAA